MFLSLLRSASGHFSVSFLCSYTLVLLCSCVLIFSLVIALYRLVDRLVSLAKEHEELLQVLANERSQRCEDTQRIADQFRSEIKLLEDKVRRTEEDINEAQSKRGMALGMLSLYQNKVTQLNEKHIEVSKQLTDSSRMVKSFEDQVKSLEALIISQRGTIESLTASKTAEYEAKLAIEAENLRKDELLKENAEIITSLEKSLADIKVKQATIEKSNEEYLSNIKFITEKNKSLEDENSRNITTLGALKEKYEALEEEERNERKLLSEEHMKFELEHQRSIHLEQEKAMITEQEHEKQRLINEKNKEILDAQQQKFDRLQEEESKLLQEEREKYSLLERKDNERYAALKEEEKALLREEREKYAKLQIEEQRIQKRKKKVQAGAGTAQ